MKVKIETIQYQDDEQTVWMGVADGRGTTIGSAWPGKRDTDPETSRARLRALKDADATLYAAKAKVERLLAAEEKRLERARERRGRKRGS